jgi:hypothetical protein
MPGANSNIKLQEIVDDAGSLGDVSPALATGGFSNAPALSIANDVMQTIINGGPVGQPYNWKWNRINVPTFTTISYQQDYFIPGVVNVAWLEHAWASQINQTSIPKQKQQLEVKKDLDVTYEQNADPGKICWLPNDLLQTGTWGANPLGPTATNSGGDTINIGPNLGGLQNPGPGVIYTNPIGILSQPTNATTCITDPNGNLWTLTTFGTCGSTQPTWPANPTYPTIPNPTAVATTVTDGTAVWTAINPKGQGFRLNPIPPQNGVAWQIVVEAQKRAPRFANLEQTLEPIPDDYAWTFKQGFFAECYRRNPDPKVRSKYTLERQLFLEALDKAVRQADREEDDYGFYPGASIMDNGWGTAQISAAYPYGPWSSR